MKTAKEIQENLPSFTGTEQYYQHICNLLLTDGAKYLAESAEAWWLLDLVASYQGHPKVKNEDFQVYQLKVNPDKSAIVKITDGNNHILAQQEIEYTDFPLDKITLWVEYGVCLMPSEH